ncbi:hypothetical protein Ancab_006362 [Ancistrocladus abbreviatus]
MRNQAVSQFPWTYPTKETKRKKAVTLGPWVSTSGSHLGPWAGPLFVGGPYESGLHLFHVGPKAQIQPNEGSQRGRKPIPLRTCFSYLPIISASQILPRRVYLCLSLTGGFPSTFSNMAGIRLQPEEPDLPQTRTPAAGELISDDERSIAADSWSIKSEYGSTLDDEQRHADASDALAAANLRPASDYSSDKEEEEGDGISSMLGLQSYWDATYSDELANFREHGHAGEVWFGADVMETVASWTKNLCVDISKRHMSNCVEEDGKAEPVEQEDPGLSTWSVLDIGTGNGLLLHELAKQGFSDLTGIDYSEDAINLARGLAGRDGFTNISFLVDDVLGTKFERQFSLVMDKGTLDAIGLHPDGPIKRIMYWDSVAKLVAPGGVLVITSCNSTKDELVQEVENFNQRRNGILGEHETPTDQETVKYSSLFRYLDHVRSYPTFMFGGVVGSRVATVAFLRE